MGKTSNIFVCTFPYNETEDTKPKMDTIKPDKLDGMLADILGPEEVDAVELVRSIRSSEDIDSV